MTIAGVVAADALDNFFHLVVLDGAAAVRPVERLQHLVYLFRLEPAPS